MRLFVAIELPSELRRRVGEALGQLASVLPRARWVAAENLHLTLAFLGERPSADLPGLDRALKPVFGSRPRLSLELGSCGRFPERGRARVLWIGFSESRELIDLADGVRLALERRLEHGPGERPFHPHLTVARCSRPWSAESVATWRQARPAGLGEPFRVERGVLVESRLGSGGASYSILQSYPLEGTACSGPV